MDVLIPFAKDKMTEKIVSVEDVNSGLNCNCSCLFCGVDMVARKGTEKTNHFAHRSKHTDEDTPCPASFERSVFWMCRLILEESSTFITPDYILMRHDFKYNQHLEKQVTCSKALEYKKVTFPFTMSELSHKDAVLLQIGKYQIALTLNFKFNLFDYTYRSEPFIINEQKFPHVCIDFKNLRSVFMERKTGFKRILHEKLLYSVSDKSWLYHPREEVILKEYQGRLEKISQQRVKKYSTLFDSNASTSKKETMKKSLNTQRDPVFAGKRSKEDIDTRLNALISSARELKNLGYSNARLCNICKYTSSSDAISCGYCSESDFEEITLNNDFFHCIESKFYTWNYPELSLAVVTKDK